MEHVARNGLQIRVPYVNNTMRDNLKQMRRSKQSNKQ